MVDVRPLRGLRYNTRLVGGLAPLICPPYDVISSEHQQALYRSSPYNVVRLELTAEPPPGAGDKYAQARQTFQEWQAAGVLVRDQKPAFYVSRHRFPHGDGVLERHGITGCLRLGEHHRRMVFPHEETSEAPKRDRGALMEACRANISPIMGLYRDPEGELHQLLTEVMRGSPEESFTTGEGEELALWMVTEPERVEHISAALRDQPVYIADGHHRYETALEYRNGQWERYAPSDEDAPHNFMLMTLIALDDPGLLVLPYHRIVGGLDPPTSTRLRDRLLELFEIERVEVDLGQPERMVALVEERGQDTLALGLLGPEGEGPYLLTLKDAAKMDSLALSEQEEVLHQSEIWILHQMVLKPVLGPNPEAHLAYRHDAQKAVRDILSSQYQMAFFMRAFPLDLFEEVVRSGIRLPPKSTLFSPKLPTGLVVRTLEGGL